LKKKIKGDVTAICESLCLKFMQEIVSRNKTSQINSQAELTHLSAEINNVDKHANIECKGTKLRVSEIFLKNE
jgi:hypothetical protein